MDLDHVHPLCGRLHVRRLEHLAHGRQTDGRPDPFEHDQALFAQAPEVVRRASQLVGVRTQHGAPGCGDGLGDGGELLLGLDGTRTCDHREGVVTEADSADVDHGPLDAAIDSHCLAFGGFHSFLGTAKPEASGSGSRASQRLTQTRAR